MSDNVDLIINTHLTQRPGARHAYDHDPTMHHDIERTRSMLAVVEAAMQREGIPYDSAERVLSEVVSVGLDGWEREKRNRERLLLLADMTPSASDCTITQPFTDAGPGAARLADDTGQMLAWLEKQEERLREATGYDVPGGASRVRPDEEPT